MLIYSANGELGDALVERVRMMMKEVEVGDEYLGKVVKTTTFGAFIELAKGTDGLLHISNVSPGERVESVEDVLSKGDEVNVRVVEVDRERGASACALPTTPRSPASRWRNWRASAQAAAAGAPRATAPAGTAASAPGVLLAATVSGALARVSGASATEPRAPHVHTPDNHAGLRREGRHRARFGRALGGARLLDRHGLGGQAEA